MLISIHSPSLYLERPKRSRRLPVPAPPFRGGHLPNAQRRSPTPERRARCGFYARALPHPRCPTNATRPRTQPALRARRGGEGFRCGRPCTKPERARRFFVGEGAWKARAAALASRRIVGLLMRWPVPQLRCFCIEAEGGYSRPEDRAPPGVGQWPISRDFCILESMRGGKAPVYASRDARPAWRLSTFHDCQPAAAGGVHERKNGASASADKNGSVPSSHCTDWSVRYSHSPRCSSASYSTKCSHYTLARGQSHAPIFNTGPGPARDPFGPARPRSKRHRLSALCSH